MLLLLRTVLLRHQTGLRDVISDVNPTSVLVRMMLFDVPPHVVQVEVSAVAAGIGASVGLVSGEPGTAMYLVYAGVNSATDATLFAPSFLPRQVLAVLAQHR